MFKFEEKIYDIKIGDKVIAKTDVEGVTGNY